MSMLTDVGRRNIEFIHNYLRLDGLHCVAEDVGGSHPRQVSYSPRTGKVRLRRLPALAGGSITVRETAYLSRIAGESQGGDVELFG